MQWIEFPLIRDLVAEKLQEMILDVLRDRFDKKVPTDVRKLLAKVKNDKKLRKLTVLAARCANLDAFKEQLLK